MIVNSPDRHFLFLGLQGKTGVEYKMKGYTSEHQDYTKIDLSEFMKDAINVYSSIGLQR